MIARLSALALLLAAAPAVIVRALVVASLILPLPALAQSVREPGWIVDERTGCRMWDLSPEPGESVTWSGPCVNRYAEGRDVQRWSTIGRPTDRYSGELKGGKANGRGVYVGADGDRYEGEWKDGRPHGQGTKTTFKGEGLQRPVDQRLLPPGRPHGHARHHGARVRLPLGRPIVPNPDRAKP